MVKSLISKGLTVPHRREKRYKTTQGLPKINFIQPTLSK
jgi:hypothetical protein